MNRTALSVVALAVGAVLIIGLYNIYNPQVKGMSHDVFDKIHISRMADSGPNTPYGMPQHLANTFSHLGNSYTDTAFRTKTDSDRYLHVDNGAKKVYDESNHNISGNDVDWNHAYTDDAINSHGERYVFFTTKGTTLNDLNNEQRNDPLFQMAAQQKHVNVNTLTNTIHPVDVNSVHFNNNDTLVTN